MTNQVSKQFETLAQKAADTLRQRATDDQIRIQVGSATCENAAGSNEVLDEFRKHIAASGRDDIVLHQTGCTGRCSREPIVGVFAPGQMPVKYERVDRELVHAIFTQHIQQGKPVLERMLDGPIQKIARYDILICGSVRCGWKGPKPFGEILAENSAPPASARAGLRDPGELFRRVQHGRGRQVLASAGSARQSALSRGQRGRPGRDHPRAPPRAAGRSSACRCRARPWAASSWNSTATWPFSTAKAAWPCATTA